MPAFRAASAPAGGHRACLRTASAAIPTGPGWQFEVKHDGSRVIARADAGEARIWSRNGLAWTKAMSGIAAGQEALGELVLDGEAVCQRDDASSDFHALRGEDGSARALLWAFDLLFLDAEDLRARPVEARRGV